MIGNIKKKKKENLKISKKLKSLIGAVKLPENFDEEKAKDEYLTKKIFKLLIN